MKKTILLIVLLLLSCMAISAQDFATTGVPTTITTGCIQNGTLNATAATMIIYNMTGNITLPLTNEYRIAQGLFGANITFNTTGKYITAETCNFSTYNVQGSEFIIVSDALNFTTNDTRLLGQLQSMSGVDNFTTQLLAQQNATLFLIYNNTIFTLNNLTFIESLLGQQNISLSVIQTVLSNLTNVTFNINESNLNLSALNQSITQAIQAPRNYSITVILLILLLVMIITSIWYHPPVFLFLTGAMAIMTGFVIRATVGTWILFIFLGLGFIYIIMGLKKM